MQISYICCRGWGGNTKGKILARMMLQSGVKAGLRLDLVTVFSYFTGTGNFINSGKSKYAVSI